MNSKLEDIEGLRKDIQVLKAAVSLVCDWISEKFDIEILDKTEFLSCNSGNKDLKEIEKIRLKITGEEYEIPQDQTPSRTTKTNTFPLLTDDSESSYKNHDDDEDNNEDTIEDTIEDIHHRHENHGHFYHGQKGLPLPSTFISSSESQMADVDTLSEKNCPTKRKKSGPTTKRPRKLKPKPTMSSNVSTNSEEVITDTIQCEICGKFLNGTVAMKRHVQTHKNFRPHVCLECGKSFQRNFHLKTHMMIHTGDKKHQCRFCGRLFLLPKDLICHERTHTGEKPFACTYCPRRFTLKSHLVMHTRTHTGEKPYKCDMCDKCFSQSNSLRVHKKTHMKTQEDNANVSTPTDSTELKSRKISKQSLSEQFKESSEGEVASASTSVIIKGQGQKALQSKLQQHQTQNNTVFSRGHHQTSQQGAPLVTILNSVPVQNLLPLQPQSRQLSTVSAPQNNSQQGQTNGALFVFQYPS